MTNREQYKEILLRHLNKECCLSCEELDSHGLSEDDLRGILNAMEELEITARQEAYDEHKANGYKPF